MLYLNQKTQAEEAQREYEKQLNKNRK